MKFENKGKWFNESEDTDKDLLNDEQQELAMEDDAGDLLAEDEMNLAKEDIDDDSEGIFNDKDEACKQRDESSQKNEANMLRDTEIAFDNIGGGISCFFESDKYGQKQLDISVGLFSSSSRGNYTKSYGTMSRAEAEKQQAIDKPKILKEFKTLADNLDKNVKTLLAKYGYILSK